MFEQLMKDFTKERDKLFDRCTKKLMESTGLTIPEDATHFELINLMDEFHRKHYKIQHEYKNNIDRIKLTQRSDLYEDVIAEYQIKTIVER